VNAGQVQGLYGLCFQAAQVAATVHAATVHVISMAPCMSCMHEAQLAHVQVIFQSSCYLGHVLLNSALALACQASSRPLVERLLPSRTSKKSSH
jgi:hypothetical protein